MGAPVPPAYNHFTIDVHYIKTLPSTDKLFVLEQEEALRELKTPLLRKYGLICENLDCVSLQAALLSVDAMIVSSIFTESSDISALSLDFVVWQHKRSVHLAVEAGVSDRPPRCNECQRPGRRRQC